MVCGECCGGGSGDPETEKGNKFVKGSGENDLSDGPAKNRGCTDIICIPVFVAAQVVWVIITVAFGFSTGDPTKLYKPRDYQGAYCGVKDNWHLGPNTEKMETLGFTMNVTTTADMVMKQFVCSTQVKNELTSSLSATELGQYECDCCFRPCAKCNGALNKGEDLTSLTDVSKYIDKKMADLTDVSKGSELFNPAGANGDMFSTNAFWQKATEYFNMVCLPSCGTDFGLLEPATAASRDYTYTPSPDHELKTWWEKLLNLNSAPQAITDALASFTFKAYPKDVCPYNPELCVPFPGVKFKELGMDYCTFEMAKEVIDSVGGVVSDAFTSMGGTAFTSKASESFGKWVGDFQKTVSTFIIVSVLSFVVGIIFLVVLRFTVGICVWLAVFLTVILFFLGGSFTFVLSGQCRGQGIWDTGKQVAVSITVTAKVAATNLATGNKAASEDMDPNKNGEDYVGAQRYTRHGFLCQKWDDQTVMPEFKSTNTALDNEALLDNAFCRNPWDPDAKHHAKTIWCITSDPLIPWQECVPIGVIQPECHDGYEIEGESMRDVLYWISWVIWGFGVIFFLAVLCLVNRIRLAIALNKVAAEFLACNPHVILIPIVQALIGIIWVISWCFGASFLLSQVPDGYVSQSAFTYKKAYGTASSCAFWEFGDHCNGTPGECNGEWPTGSVWRDNNQCILEDGEWKCWHCAPPRYILDWRFAVSFFVFLWNNAFIVAFGQILIAMCVGLWFFSSEKGKTGILLPAVGTIFRYHVGSVAFGSFIIAVIQFIRYLMYYFEKQAEAQKNKIMVYILKCVQCCIWCFEKCVKFLNKNAYIQIALLGKNFCTSAKKAFFLILRNMLRFGTLGALSGIVNALGFIFIMTGTAVIGYFLVREMHPDVSPFIPVVCFLFMGYIVSKVFMNVFGLAVDTSLQCFLALEEMGTSQDCVPSALKNFFANNKQTASNQPQFE